jgi:hypothetical protein
LHPTLSIRVLHPTLSIRMLHPTLSIRVLHPTLGIRVLHPTLSIRVLHPTLSIRVLHPTLSIRVLHPTLSIRMLHPTLSIRIVHYSFVPLRTLMCALAKTFWQLPSKCWVSVQQTIKHIPDAIRISLGSYTVEALQSSLPYGGTPFLVAFILKYCMR